ncbi:MAG: lycopene cyclase domain-containing protein [Anaerolineae bacterium]|nr:lycopene cyclase domain-containing protein [Anaerolineae bacterium]
MTYFQFLAIFLGIPIVALMGIALFDHRRGARLPVALGNFPAWLVIGAVCFIAVAWTTPWDNYLVATGVWYYDPLLVTGITLGWVPIEEYTFFVLQPILIGLWMAFWMRRLPVTESGAEIQGGGRIRAVALGLTGLIWLASVALLASGWRSGTYLGLELGWMLPPLMLQLAFGADILWKHRRFTLLGALIPTVYLSAADFIAIGAGTWTISPEQSLQWYVGGVLPIEEIIFFFLTSSLVACSVALALAQESRARLPRPLRTWISRRTTLTA